MNVLSRIGDLHQLVKETVCDVDGRAVSLDEAIATVHAHLERVKSKRNNVYVIGNGGSAGIASHHVVDLTNVVKAPAVWVGEPGLMSCMGNDYGYEFTFSRPLEALARPGDLLVAISSSGKSKNILNACDVVKEKEGTVIALSGFQADNPLRQAGNISIWTSKDDYGLVETAHFFILHSIIDMWISIYGRS